MLNQLENIAKTDPKGLHELIKEQLFFANMDLMEQKIHKIRPDIVLTESFLRDKPDSLIFKADKPIGERIHDIKNWLIHDFQNLSAEEKKVRRTTLEALVVQFEAYMAPASEDTFLFRDKKDPGYVAAGLYRSDLKLKAHLRELCFLLKSEDELQQLGPDAKDLEKKLSQSKTQFNEDIKKNPLSVKADLDNREKAAYVFGLSPLQWPEATEIHSHIDAWAQDPQQRLPHQIDTFYAYFSKKPAETKAVYQQWYQEVHSHYNYEGQSGNNDKDRFTNQTYPSFDFLTQKLADAVKDESLTKNLLPLFLHPGVLQNRGALFAFIKNLSPEEQTALAQQENPAASLLKKFSDHLGTQEVYRGMVLTPEQNEKIRQEGIKSVGQLNGHHEENVHNLLAPGGSPVQLTLADHVKARFEEGKSQTYKHSAAISGSIQGKISRYIGQAFGDTDREGNIKDKHAHLYVYRMEIPKIDLIYTHKDASEETDQGAYSKGKQTSFFPSIGDTNPDMKGIRLARPTKAIKGTVLNKGVNPIETEGDKQYQELELNEGTEVFLMGKILPEWIQDIKKASDKTRSFGPTSKDTAASP